ncbi:MAG: hypothetical protein AAB869_03640 [Patescibacteria group bacterium]
MTKNSPPPPLDDSEPSGQEAQLRKNTESSEDFLVFADVLKSQYIDTNKEYSTAEQLAVLNKVADKARERVLRIWTEQGMAGRDSDAYFKKIADAVKLQMQRDSAAGLSKQPSYGAPAPEAAVIQPAGDIVKQNTSGGALAEGLVELDLVTSRTVTATTPQVPPAKTSQTTVVPPVDASHREENEPREFDPEKWKGGDLSAMDAYEKYCKKVRDEEEKTIEELCSLGASDTQKQEIQRVIGNVRDRVIAAAMSQGPIPFTRYLKLDRGFQVLRSGYGYTAQREPQAVTQQKGGDKKGLADFSELKDLRGTFPPAPETDTTLTGKERPIEAEDAHHPATHEPPPAIIAVSTDAARVANNEVATPSPETGREKAEAEKLNALKKEIDKKHEEIRKLREDEKDDLVLKKKLNAAHRALGKLHQEERDIAIGLIDGGTLFGLVKPADVLATKFYKSKIPTKTSPEERKKLEAELSKDTVDAHFEAVRRKNSFAEALGAKGVTRDAANDLYLAFIDRAKEVEWLKRELEGGNATLLERDDRRAREILEWHGISARQPEQVLVQVTAWSKEYNTIPPKQERPKRGVTGRDEKKRPVEKIFESVAAGQEIDDHTLRAFLKDKRTTLEERARLEAELNTRKARREAERAASARGGAMAEKGQSLRGRVIDVVQNYKEGDTPPPEKLLRDYADDPAVVKFLNEHPGFKPREKKKKETIKGITDEAERLIANADAGEISPDFTDDQKRILAENDIPYDETTSQGDAFARLRERIKAEMALTQFPVPIAPGDRGVLIFHTWKNKIPEGIQVQRESGGEVRAPATSADEDAAPNGETLKNVLLGSGSLLKQCSMDIVNISEGSDGHCKVYVNFDTNPKHIGWNYWGAEGSPYAPFLRSLFKEPYKNVKLSRDGQKVTLRFSDQHAKTPPETKIVFVAPVETDPGAPATDSEAQNKNPWHPFFGSEAAAEQSKLREIFKPAFKPPQEISDRLWYLERTAEQKFHSGDEAGLAAARDAIRVFLDEQRAAVRAGSATTGEVNTSNYDFKNVSPYEIVDFSIPGHPYFGYKTAEDREVLSSDREMLEQRIQTEKETWAGPASTVEAEVPAPETLESLMEKERVVGRASFVWGSPIEGESLESRWDRVAPLGMQWFHDAIVIAHPKKFDEERFNAKDVEYLKSCALWLHHQYDTVIVPALEKMKAESAQAADAADFLDVERKDMPDVPTLTDEVEQRVINPADFSESVTDGFEEQFGITNEELVKVEGFKKLSEGQQLLVLKNLEQIALTDIKKEARTQQKAEWGKMPWYKKAWKQLYSAGMNPEHRIAELEKELLAKHRGGINKDPAYAKIIAENLANVEQLAKVAAEGPGVNVKPGTGELEMVYVSGKDLFESNDDPAITPEQKKLFADFNTIASELSAFPREWGYDTEKAGMIEQLSGDRRRYEKVKAEYAAVRASILRLYTDRFAEEIAKDPQRSKEDPEKQAMRAMNAIDERVQLNQLFNNHPDAEAALAQVEDQNTVWAAAKEFWKSKGMFIAGGALARWGTIAISGGVMLPAIGLIGVGVGGMIGMAEGKKLMKAHRAEGRMSEEDLREEIEFTTYETNPDGSAKLDAEGIRIPKGAAKREIKEFTDAAFFSDRIERLAEKLSVTADADERALIAKKIAQTVALAGEKFDRGMINFGGAGLEADDKRKGATIANRLSFIQAMATGRLYNVVDHDALEAKIEKITGLHQAMIEDKRKAEIRKIAAKSAMIRGAFALAGAGIAQSVKEILSFGEVKFGADQVKAVGDAIRERGINSGDGKIGGVVIPKELLDTQRAADARGFEEYMTDTDPTHRAQLLETLGMTKEQMDAKIADLLGKTRVANMLRSYADSEIDKADPEAFSPKNFNKNIPGVVGRPLSTEEILVLRATGGLDDRTQLNMAQHNKLIDEMHKSPTPLSTEEIKSILERTPGTPPWLAPNEEIVPWSKVPQVSEAVPLGLAQEPPGSELLPYKVVSGDNFTKILKVNIPELRDLSPQGQENAIQNLLRSLSPEEQAAIGLGSDPDKLIVDQTLDLNKVTQLLHEKTIGGEDLIARAQKLGGGTAIETPAGGAATEVTAAGTPMGAEVPRPADTPLSMEETAVTWHNLPEEMKLPQAQLEAGRYLDADIERLFHKPLFASVSPEWLSIRDRDALAILETDPRTLSGSGESFKGYDWPTVAKIQQYINEQGITKEKGYMPTEKETLADFLRRALSEKVLKDGPSRPLVVGRILK